MAPVTASLRSFDKLRLDQLGEVWKQRKDEISRAIIQTTPELVRHIDALTPVDTGYLASMSNTRLGRDNRAHGVIVGSYSNVTPYAGTQHNDPFYRYYAFHGFVNWVQESLGKDLGQQTVKVYTVGDAEQRSGRAAWRKGMSRSTRSARLNRRVSSGMAQNRMVRSSRRWY